MSCSGTLISDLESRVEIAESNMMKAAELGKQLLEEKEKLRESLEESRKQNENLESLMGSLNQQLDSMASQMDSQALKYEEKMDSLMKEHGKGMKSCNIQLKESQSKVESLKILNSELNKELEGYKGELTKRNNEKNESKNDETNPLELQLMDLQDQIKIYKDEKLKSEFKNRELEENLEYLNRELNLKSRENENLREKIEEKEVELMGYLQHLEKNREVANIDDSLELPTNNHQNSKGNSLFSEVEDRRTLVESKLNSLTAKNNELKNMYDEKVQQLNRIKFQNMTLLNLTAASTNSNTTTSKGTKMHVAKLEEELNYERKINKNLSQQLEAIKPLQNDPQSNQQIQFTNDADSDDNKKKSPSVQCTNNQQHDIESSEYSYLSSMLRNKSAEVDDLKERLRLQMRSTLEESDNLRDYKRKLDGYESTTNRLRAENYTLKLQIEELKNTSTHKNNVNEIHKQTKSKENKLIYEDIKFDDKKDEEIDRNNSNKENNTSKKSVKIACKVDVIDNNEKVDVKMVDGGNRLKDMKDNSTKTNKHQPKMNKVIEVQDDNQNECNTQ